VGADGRLDLAGFFVTAATFGPARNAYGLFPPNIREDLGVPTATLGLVAGGLYAGYLGALLAAGMMADLYGMYGIFRFVAALSILTRPAPDTR
jgi:MFS family permease